MTQQAPPSLPRSTKPRPGAMKAGNPTSQHALMDLKHRILAALGKLADRDTQQIAVEELDKIVETISADCVTVCLSCLYDSDMQQKSVVKKECVRLFGSLASMHGDLIIPHLPKVIGSIMRRLRDPDSSVRDACVDAMGILSSRMLSSSSSSSSPGQENGIQAASSSTSSLALTLATFSKPLFDALSEQNKSVQTGAAMCLARVIESAKSPPLGAMARLCLRICKFMSNPNFVARPALLAVIGSLSQVGALGQPQLAMLMPCVHEALENSDWATRKAAAETLSRICSNLGHALASFRPSTLRMLESCRFDKVKPVRDGVHDATQLWKSLPGADAESPGSAKKNDGPELAVAMQKLVLQSPSPTSRETSLVAGGSPGNGKTPEAMANSSPNRLPKLSLEKPLVAIKKRVPALTDKKLNPDFFQKLSARSTEDWEIEVAVPRMCPSSMSGAPKVDMKGLDNKVDDVQMCTERSILNEEQLFQGVERYSNDSCLVSDDEGEAGNSLHSDVLLSDGSPVFRSQGLQKPKMGQEEGEKKLGKHLIQRDVDDQAWDACGHIRGSSSTGALEENKALSERSNWHFVCKQLSQLEQQQSSLMQMVQDFMVSSQETMFALQARVRGLENMVEEMTYDLGFPARRRINGAVGGYENSGIRPSGKYLLGSEYMNARFSKSVDIGHPFPDREPAPESMNAGMKAVRHSAFKKSSDPALEDWDDYTFRNSRGRSAGTYLVDGLHGSQRSNNMGAGERSRTDSEDSGTDQVVMRRVWDKVPQPGPARRGEGPSARSVWQASKDEATLAAIRVAGEDAGVSEVDTLSGGVSRLANPESGSESTLRKNGGQDKGQWSLWGSALEFVHAGDMESAYTEVLCTEDELMLVRLMSRTGPVLDQLTITTASEMLHAVGQLLQQQNYFDCCVAWIQQVADMVVNSGVDCLEHSLDAKKELLLSLQESITMSVPEDCSGSSAEQLLQLLANAWSIDVEQFGTDL